MALEQAVPAAMKVGEVAEPTRRPSGMVWLPEELVLPPEPRREEPESRPRPTERVTYALD